jgi:bla regulator protein blaR1
MKRGLLAAVLLASSATVIGQQPAPQRAFDVVSIKPSPPGAQNRLPRISPGRVELFNTTLKQLIASAYSRFPFDPREVVGGPAWIDSERFDIVATMERPPQFDQTGMLGELNGMLRALIEQRFGVKAHNEQREGDVYTLTFARSDRKTGAGLRQVPDACAAALKELTGAAPLPQRSGPPPCSFGGPPGRLIGTGVTIAMFASVLSGNAGRTVIDRTGLAGSFDIEMNFDPSSAAQAPPGAPPGPQPIDASKPSIFTALQEQLGLKLEPTRGPIDVLVIDQAERPTPN